MCICAGYITPYDVKTFDTANVAIISVADRSDFSSPLASPTNVPNSQIPWLVDPTSFYEIVEGTAPSMSDWDPIMDAFADIKRMHSHNDTHSLIFVCVTNLGDANYMGYGESPNLVYPSFFLFAQRYPDCNVIVGAGIEKLTNEANTTSSMEDIYGPTVRVRAGTSTNAEISAIKIRFDATGKPLEIVEQSTTTLDAAYPHFDAGVASLLASRRQDAVNFYSQTVTTSTVDLNGERGGRNDAGDNNCDIIGGCRRNDCPVGRLLMGMMLDWCTLESLPCDLAMTNGGGIRASLDAGDINLGHIGDVLPFQNRLEIRKVKGKGLRKYLESIPSEYQDYNATTLSACNFDGGFIQSAGLRYAINPTDPYNKLVGIPEVNLNGHWYPLEDEQEYTVVNTDYAWSSFEDKSEPLTTSASYWSDLLYNYLKRDDMSELANGLDLSAGGVDVDYQLYDQVSRSHPTSGPELISRCEQGGSAF